MLPPPMIQKLNLFYIFLKKKDIYICHPPHDPGLRPFIYSIQKKYIYTSYEGSRVSWKLQGGCRTLQEAPGGSRRLWG